MNAYSCFMVAGSLVLTMTFIAVGISFFGPYWLSNVPKAYDAEINFSGNKTFFISDYPYELFPDRGLWAQCGAYCYWFWTNNYSLQYYLLTPLS